MNATIFERFAPASIILSIVALLMSFIVDRLQQLSNFTMKVSNTKYNMFDKIALAQDMQDVIQDLTGDNELECKLTLVTLPSDEIENKIGTLKCVNDTWYVHQGVEVFEDISGEQIWNFTGPLVLFHGESDHGMKALTVGK